MMQEYICPRCCYAGVIVIREHAGVYEVLNALEADHQKNSPECEAGRLGIRVRNPEMCTPEQWESVKESVREDRELRQERDA